MNEISIAAIEQAMKFERARKDAPPIGYPALPEVPGSRYTRQDFFALEQKHLWQQSWVCIGRDENVRDPEA